MLGTFKTPPIPDDAEVLKVLKAHDAFAGIESRKCLVPPDQIRERIAVGVQSFLEVFYSDAKKQEILAHRDKHGKNAIRAIRKGDFNRAREEIEEAYKIDPDRYRLEPAKARWKRWTGHLIIDLYITLHRKTRMSTRDILELGIPPILAAMRDSFPILPKTLTGLSGPAGVTGKWRRYVEGVLADLKRKAPQAKLRRRDILRAMDAYAEKMDALTLPPTSGPTRTNTRP